MSVAVNPSAGAGRVRRRRQLAVITVASALLSAGVLAGCGDDADPSAVGRPSPVATQAEADSNLPDVMYYQAPDPNRERGWEKGAVHPNDP